MRFDNDPVNEELYCVPIIRPRHRKPISFTVGTPNVRGVWTHWFGGKTVACNAPDDCAACEVNVKRIWAGHVLAYQHVDDAVCLVSFTLPTKDFLQMHETADEGLFGISCRLIRMGGRETGPVAGLFLGMDYDRPRLVMKRLEKLLNRLYADNANQRTVNLVRGPTP